MMRSSLAVQSVYRSSVCSREFQLIRGSYRNIQLPLRGFVSRVLSSQAQENRRMTTDWFQMADYCEAVKMEIETERVEGLVAGGEDDYMQAVMDATALDRFAAQKTEESRVGAIQHEQGMETFKRIREMLAAKELEPLLIPLPFPCLLSHTGPRYSDRTVLRSGSKR